MIAYANMDEDELYELSLRALRDIWAFADLINFRGGSKNFYQLHRDMAELNCRNQKMRHTERAYRRRMFLIPREHRKSTVNTVLYSLWRIYRNPDIRIIIGCNVKELALDMVREIRTYLEDEELGEYVWNNRPHISGPMIPRLTKASNNYKKHSYTEANDGKITWTAMGLQVNRPMIDKQPTLQALSVGMRPTGKHCDLVIFDDIVDWVNSDSPEKAERVVRRWAMDIESVVTKKAIYTEISPGFSEWVGNEIVVNGTRYYEWDWYAHHVGNSREEQEQRLGVTGWSAMVMDIYVNGVDSGGGYICPEIFGDEEEKDLKHSETLTPRVWAAQYRNIVISESTASFKVDNIKVVFPTNYQKTAQPTICNFVNTEEVSPAGGYQVYPIRLYMMVDLAASMRSTADKRAVSVGGYDEKRRLHIVESKAGIWTPEELFTHIYTFAEKWNLYMVHYEGGVGLQEYFGTTLSYWLKLKDYRHISPIPIPVLRTVSKEKRIELTLSPLIESGNLYVNSHVWVHSDLKGEIKFFNTASKRNQDNTLDTIEMLGRTSPISSSYRTQKNPMYHTQPINKRFGGVR